MQNIENNPILLASEMVKFQTITPKDDGILLYLSEILEKYNFKSEIKYFGENEVKTGNLYSKFGNSGRNFCFAGHVDVVSPGDIKKWTKDPFSAEIIDGKLYGRGVVDMKGGVAAFISAMCKFLKNNKDFSETISIILTCDEEASGEFGLQKMLEHIDKNDEKITTCIIGEPTSQNKIGDMIRLGRRGSVNFEVEFFGLQGHVAYKNLVQNPIYVLTNFISALKHHKLDNGNEFYESSNLEFVDIATDNLAKSTNVTPSVAKCMFNIRYNNLHTGEELVEFVRKKLEEIASGFKHEMRYKISNDSFLYGKTSISKIVTDVIERNPNYEINSVIGNCIGGTTDGRYVIEYCKDVVELGLKFDLAHKINEHAKIEDITRLSDIYYEVLCGYFHCK